MRITFSDCLGVACCLAWGVLSVPPSSNIVGGQAMEDCNGTDWRRHDCESVDGQMECDKKVQVIEDNGGVLDLLYETKSECNATGCSSEELDVWVHQNCIHVERDGIIQ